MAKSSVARLSAKALATVPSLATMCSAGRYTSRMRIFLNGQPHECGATTTVATLLVETGRGGRRVAVEVNREIVPRSRHAGHVLHEDDRVEIVHAMGGG